MNTGYYPCFIWFSISLDECAWLPAILNYTNDICTKQVLNHVFIVLVMIACINSCRAWCASLSMQARCLDVLIAHTLNRRLWDLEKGLFNPMDTLTKPYGLRVVGQVITVTSCEHQSLSGHRCFLVSLLRQATEEPSLTLISAWISNYMPSKVWDEMTNPFLNFRGCTVKV